MTWIFSKSVTSKVSLQIFKISILSRFVIIRTFFVKLYYKLLNCRSKVMYVWYMMLLEIISQYLIVQMQKLMTLKKTKIDNLDDDNSFLKDKIYYYSYINCRRTQYKCESNNFMKLKMHFYMHQCHKQWCMTKLLN